ncbi:MAG TPA: hypothetical protein VN972_02660, partial [Methylomirabilota bacterium]|nr:hypothetical protein [Methylomirabilota bacterium]
REAFGLEPDRGRRYNPRVRSPFPRAAAAVILAFAAISCASSFELSADEKASIAMAMDTPLAFVVPRERSIETWDRAQEYITRYSSAKLRSLTDSVLVTYDSPTYSQVPSPVESGSGIRFGYSFSRSRNSEGIRIAVQCTPSSKLGEKDADQNAHIAAYYIKTGRIACDRCIVR